MQWTPSRLFLYFLLNLIVLGLCQTAEAQRFQSEEIFRIHPQWNPQGDQIAYYERIGNAAEIVVIDTDGSESGRFMTDGQYAANPSWRPDGSELAFSNAESGMMGEWNIWRMGADGSDPVLAFDPEVRSMHTAWAPDDSGIAFIAMEGEESHVLFGQFDSGEIKRITSGEGRRFHPKFSGPDRVVYDLTVDGLTQICFSTLSTRKETCLPPQGDRPTSTPTMSADGMLVIAAVLDPVSETRDLWSFDMLREEWSQLTATSVESEGGPHISPDGSMIAFHSDRMGQRDIFVMKIDGTARRKLTGQ